MLSLDVLNDGFVHFVARHPDGAAVDDPRKTDDGDVGGPAADVDDHVSVRLGDGKTGPDGRRHRFLHQIDLAGLRAERRFANRPLFHLRDL